MNLKDFNPTKQALSLFGEFREFAFKGNVIDLAIGVIIGGAFSNIVKSFVDNLLMPLIGAIVPREKKIAEWSTVMRGHEIPYGKFLGDVVNFLLVAAVLFVFVVKLLGWIMKLKKEEAKEPPPLSKDQELLTEIRDLLKQRGSEPARDA
jgi:large conductance mechanosensitive channel